MTVSGAPQSARPGAHRLSRLGWLALLLLPGQLACSPAPAPAERPSDAAAPAASPTGGVAVRGWAPPVTGGFRAAVFLTPEGALDLEVPTEPVRMDQFGLAFIPGVLVARAGQEVAFTNGDDVLHNVHLSASATRETVFNIATPIAGAYLHTFDAPGTFTLSCDVHPAMAAYILVTEAPYATVAEAGRAVRAARRAAGTLRCFRVERGRRAAERARRRRRGGYRAAPRRRGVINPAGAGG